MAITNAEKQARYRTRHLGVDGTKVAVHFFLSVPAKKQLDRLARHKGCTVLALVEELAATAERRVLDRLDPEAQKTYYDGDAVPGGR
jgi:hypothetical protein